MLKKIKFVQLFTSVLLFSAVVNVNAQEVVKAVTIDSFTFSADSVHRDIIKITTMQKSQVTFLLNGPDMFSSYSDNSDGISAKFKGRKAIVDVSYSKSNYSSNGSFTTVCGLDVSFQINAIREDQWLSKSESLDLPTLEQKVVINVPSNC
ncbi:hypothetical protein [uncultured Alteromonas sp.]|uniref:hypothetical protein n=1 Tax=uncultured Alteromonas sp. TaxID=179113 RepID=UPI0030CD41C4|tara:strand:- start:1898 stop:2347 length:450 start_codon:yes stop_codon:yes gene_type:complete